MHNCRIHDWKVTVCCGFTSRFIIHPYFSEQIDKGRTSSALFEYASWLCRTIVARTLHWEHHIYVGKCTYACACLISEHLSLWYFFFILPTFYHKHKPLLGQVALDTMCIRFCSYCWYLVAICSSRGKLNQEIYCKFIGKLKIVLWVYTMYSISSSFMFLQLRLRNRKSLLCSGKN